MIVISWLREGGRRPWERGFFDLGKNIRMSNQERRIHLLMKRKRSELEGRSEDRMEGISSACLAAESTFSLPGMRL